MLIERFDAKLIGVLPKRQQENNIVREDDDLPGLRLLYEPPRHAVSPLEIQGLRRNICEPALRVAMPGKFCNKKLLPSFLNFPG